MDSRSSLHSLQANSASSQATNSIPQPLPATGRPYPVQQPTNIPAMQQGLVQPHHRPVHRSMTSGIGQHGRPPVTAPMLSGSQMMTGGSQMMTGTGMMHATMMPMSVHSSQNPNFVTQLPPMQQPPLPGLISNQQQRSQNNRPGMHPMSHMTPQAHASRHQVTATQKPLPPTTAPQQNPMVPANPPPQQHRQSVTAHPAASPQRPKSVAPAPATASAVPPPHTAAAPAPKQPTQALAPTRQAPPQSQPPPPKPQPQPLPSAQKPPPPQVQRQPTQHALNQAHYFQNKQLQEMKSQQLKKEEEFQRKRAESARLRLQKSERSRRESARFMHTMRKHTPTIPDEVIDFYLKKAGCDCPDRRVKRLVAVAAQKFMYGVIRNAFTYQQHNIRANRTAMKEQKIILNMRDISYSLKQSGVNVLKPEFFVDSAPPSSNRSGDH